MNDDDDVASLSYCFLLSPYELVIFRLFSSSEDVLLEDASFQATYQLRPAQTVQGKGSVMALSIYKQHVF